MHYRSPWTCLGLKICLWTVQIVHPIKPNLPHFVGTTHAYTIVSQGCVASKNQPNSHILVPRVSLSPGGSDVRRTHIAPSGSLPPSLPYSLATPPLSRVTRLRRVQRWLAPSPILRSHTHLLSSPTLCTQPTQGSCILSTHLYNAGLPLDLDLKKIKKSTATKLFSTGWFTTLFFPWS